MAKELKVWKCEFCGQVVLASTDPTGEFKKTGCKCEFYESNEEVDLNETVGCKA